MNGSARTDPVESSQSSWFDHLEPFDLRPLFPIERAALLELLRSLDPDEWQAPTICPGWSVHDLALHLLNGDLRFVASWRDGYQSPHGPRVEPPFGRAEVTALVDTINNRWIDGARWMSPRQLIDQLERSGAEYSDTLAAMDLQALGIPVDWIVSQPAPVWIDVAREYTERLVHQQQIRAATGRPLVADPALVRPMFDTFLLALPTALRAVPAPIGAKVRSIIAGDAGGVWTAERMMSEWRLVGDSGNEPFATVVLDQDDAWRLFTKGLSPDTVRRRAQLTGDQTALDAVLSMVTVLA
jgi:uncharacterized protein (TIGR03083 family)